MVHNQVLDIIMLITIIISLLFAIFIVMKRQHNMAQKKKRKTKHDVILGLETRKIVQSRQDGEKADEIVPFFDEEECGRTRLFTNSNHVVGVSFQGDGHCVKHVRCQDYHSFKKINKEWNVAVVSDGAGSKQNADIGSKIVCQFLCSYLEHLLIDDPIHADGTVLNEKEWDIEFRSMLNMLQKGIMNNLVTEDKPFDSFAATIIVLVYSTKGYMFAHVGDGRAAIKYCGEWKSIMTPHKGEEANQTIFSTSMIYSEIPNYKLSGVYVPETLSVSHPFEAFVLMTDGVERGPYATYQKQDLPNGDFKVVDVNTPRSTILEKSVLSILDLPRESRKDAILAFITENKELKSEPDDKTLLIGKIV